jgi:hypothetical protein
MAILDLISSAHLYHLLSGYPKSLNIPNSLVVFFMSSILGMGVEGYIASRD